MLGYISTLLLKFKHPHPAKPRLSPSKCLPIAYGAKSHITPDPDSSKLLDASCKRCVQENVASLLDYAQAADSKLLILLSAIAACQAKATVATEQAVDLLLNYVATHPNDGIVYRASNMILCAHADAGFLNETNSYSRAGADIYLSEDDPFPRFNSAILSIAQIIKFVMALAAESELAALFITAREMIPHLQTLIAIGWPKPKSPIQTNNFTAAGVTNKTIVPHRSKMMDMQFWWLCCCASQDQFCYYLDAGWADYTPNTTLTPTIKPIEAHMQVTGLRWVLKPIPCALLPVSPRVFPCRFSFFLQPYISHVCLQAKHYFPHIVNVATRVCRSPDSWVWIDHPQI
jgi:hypothetical protein